MKFATRLKVTANVSAGVISTLALGAAALGCRTLQQAIDAGNAQNDATAIKVGDVGVPFMVENTTTGDWEEAYYTITSGTVLTKGSIIASSNAGAAVSFPAGTVNVFNAPPGGWLRKVVTTDDGVGIGDLAAFSGTPSDACEMMLRDPSTGLTQKITVAALRTLFGSATPAQTINVSSPGAQVAGASFSVSGFYANGTPTALDYSINGGTTWTAAASPTIGGGAFTISGVIVPSANASQTVMVRDHATNVAGTSASFAVSAAATAPGQVTGLTLGAATDTTQALSWTAPSTGTAPFTYKVEYSADGTNWTAFGSPVSGTSATVTGLTASKLYYYRVLAINSVSTGAASTVASGSTTAAPTVVPGQVTGLTAGTPTDTTQPLSWAALSGAASYIVERSASGANSWSTVATGIAGTSYTVTGLQPSTAYDYRVTGTNTAGNGTASATVTKSTIASGASQTIGVTTPATATAYRAYTLAGSWTVTQPTALEYRTSDDAGQTWTAWASLAGATINAGGTWSASVTPTTYAANRIMSVRDASTQVAGSSSAYTVLSMAQAYKLTSLNSAGITPTTFGLTLASPDYYGVPGTVRVNVRDAGGVAANPAHVKFVFGFYNDAQGNPAPCPITNFSSSGMGQGVNGTSNSGGHTNGFSAVSLLNAGSLPGTMVAGGSFYFWCGGVTSGASIPVKLWVVFADGSYAAYNDGGANPVMLTATVP